MTLHVLMMTEKHDAFVWVTDRLARVGKNDYATVEKITYVKELGLAASIWGDGSAMWARDRLLERAQEGSLNSVLGDAQALVLALRQFSDEMVAVTQCRYGPANVPRGIIFATTGKTPHVYRLNLENPSLVAEIDGQTMVGDDPNPALLFPNYYYEHSGKSVHELLFLGIHTMRIAGVMNGRGIRGVDAWVCENGTFRQLASDDVTHYSALSESLDSSILERLRVTHAVAGGDGASAPKSNAG
jgi:hypothetical protein